MRDGRQMAWCGRIWRSHFVVQDRRYLRFSGRLGFQSSVYLCMPYLRRFDSFETDNLGSRKRGLGCATLPSTSPILDGYPVRWLTEAPCPQRE